MGQAQQEGVEAYMQGLAAGRIHQAGVAATAFDDRAAAPVGERHDPVLDRDRNIGGVLRAGRGRGGDHAARVRPARPRRRAGLGESAERRQVRRHSGRRRRERRRGRGRRLPGMQTGLGRVGDRHASPRQQRAVEGPDDRDRAA